MEGKIKQQFLKSDNNPLHLAAQKGSVWVSTKYVLKKAVVKRLHKRITRKLIMTIRGSFRFVLKRSKLASPLGYLYSLPTRIFPFSSTAIFQFSQVGILPFLAYQDFSIPQPKFKIFKIFKEMV